MGNLDACRPPFALLEAIHEEIVEVDAYNTCLARSSRALGIHRSDIEFTNT